MIIYFSDLSQRVTSLRELLRIKLGDNAVCMDLLTQTISFLCRSEEHVEFSARENIIFASLLIYSSYRIYTLQMPQSCS